MGRAVRAACAAALLALAACEAVLGLGGLTNAPADGGVRADASHRDASRGDAGPCGDTHTSSKNCGRCGHDCLGGACVNGECQPVTLVGDAGITPSAIAIDDASVYWADPENVVVGKVDKDGSNVVTLFSQGSATVDVEDPESIALDDTSVYVGDYTNGAIFLCSKTGCEGNPSLLVPPSDAGTDAGGPPGVADLTTRAPFVYWTDTETSVWRILSGGMGQPEHLATYAPDSGSVPGNIVVDATWVYWNNGDGTVQQVPLDGGSPLLVTTASQMQSGGLCLSNAVLYLTQAVSPGGTVESAPINSGGGQSTILVGGQHSPDGIAADDTNLYWVDEGAALTANGGALMMCPLSNCVPVVLASGQAGPTALAVDANAVYWVNTASYSPGSAGSVMKIAKP